MHRPASDDPRSMTMRQGEGKSSFHFGRGPERNATAAGVNISREEDLFVRPRQAVGRSAARNILEPAHSATTHPREELARGHRTERTRIVVS
jgi:hypothetical protein